MRQRVVVLFLVYCIFGSLPATLSAYGIERKQIALGKFPFAWKGKRFIANYTCNEELGTYEAFAGGDACPPGAFPGIYPEGVDLAEFTASLPHSFFWLNGHRNWEDRIVKANKADEFASWVWEWRGERQLISRDLFHTNYTLNENEATRLQGILIAKDDGSKGLQHDEVSRMHYAICMTVEGINRDVGRIRSGTPPHQFPGGFANLGTWPLIWQGKQYTASYTISKKQVNFESFLKGEICPSGTYPAVTSENVDLQILSGHFPISGYCWMSGYRIRGNLTRKATIAEERAQYIWEWKDENQPVDPAKWKDDGTLNYNANYTKNFDKYGIELHADSSHFGIEVPTLYAHACCMTVKAALSTSSSFALLFSYLLIASIAVPVFPGTIL